MRKLKEPSKVAFNSLEEVLRGKEESLNARLNDFWTEFEDDLTYKIKSLKDVNLAREWFKNNILDYLRTSVSRLQNSMDYGIQLWKSGDEEVWERIKFIIAFDTEFSYIEYDVEEGEEIDYDNDVSWVSENLYDEEAFRFDIIKECNKYILEGAALCKRIGSPAYDTWIEAMITLNDRYQGATPYKAVDLIAKAYPRMWADLCAFIHLNPPHNEKKKAVKKKKAKK